jgi:hypothetical protein
MPVSKVRRASNLMLSIRTHRFLKLRLKGNHRTEFAGLAKFVAYSVVIRVCNHPEGKCTADAAPSRRYQH